MFGSSADASGQTLVRLLGMRVRNTIFILVELALSRTLRVTERDVILRARYLFFESARESRSGCD